MRQLGDAIHACRRQRVVVHYRNGVANLGVGGVAQVTRGAAVQNLSLEFKAFPGGLPIEETDLRWCTCMKPCPSDP